MFKAYAKVRGEEVVRYPYGFDDLQAEFNDPLFGDIDFVARFKYAAAVADGFELVEVTRDERRSIPLPPGQQPVFGETPVLVDGVWTIPLVGLENPPARPDDGRPYVWNIEARAWVAVDPTHILQTSPV